MARKKASLLSKAYFL